MTKQTIQNRLREKYVSQVRSMLKEQLGVTNIMAVPKVLKVTVNVGLGHSKTDARFTESVQKTLERITGQKPILTKAKKSIAGFKIREGMPVGAVVTLRGDRMYDFLDKLISLALPRVRDFSGLSPKCVDRQGNCTIGFREHLVFPEIRADEVEKIHGLEVVITTNAGSAKAGLALLTALGFPFKK